MENKPSRIALADYIRAKGMKKQDFAKMVGVRGDSFSRWLSGHHRPGRAERILISMFTEGAVPVDAWE